MWGGTWGGFIISNWTASRLGSFVDGEIVDVAVVVVDEIDRAAGEAEETKLMNLSRASWNPFVTVARTASSNKPPMIHRKSNPILLNDVAQYVNCVNNELSAEGSWTVRRVTSNVLSNTERRCVV